MTTTDHLLVDVKDGVATLTLNRPERLNALSGDMITQSIAAIERFAVDPTVGCIVITGAERGFCAGGDVTAMNAGQGSELSSELSFEQRLDRQRASHRMSVLLYSIPKVTIAAVNGAAAGAGLSIALACDLRIASDKAKFTTAFAKVGFGGDFGITWPLTRMLGEAKAKELLFLSDVLTADQALALGLVNRVAPHDDFMSAAREMALRIARGPQVSYRYMKENVRLASTQDYASMSDREAWTHLHCGDTDDHREGVRAFVEKREPKFNGRKEREMSLRIRQIVVAARDLEKTVAQFKSVLGVQVCYRDPEVGKFGLANALFTIGDQILEIVSPIQDNTAAGRHIERHSDSGYMLILQTDDLARDRARLDRLGVRIVWQATHSDISAVHLHPKDIGAAIVSIDQPIPPASWRWAGPDWQKYASNEGAQRVLATTISAIDPVVMAKRWAEVLDTSAPVEHHDAVQIDIAAGALNFVRAKTDVIAGFAIAMRNPQIALANARAQGLAVNDDAVTICGTQFRLLAA